MDTAIIYKTLKYFEGRKVVKHLSYNALRKAVKYLESTDPELYDKIVTNKRLKKVGRASIAVDAKAFPIWITDVYLVEKEAERKDKKKKAEIVSKEEKLVIPQIISVDEQGQRIQKLRGFNLDSESSCIDVVNKVSAIYLTGQFSVSQSCKELGVKPSEFWGMIDSYDSCNVLWENTQLQWERVVLDDLDFALYKRTVEKMTTTHLVNEKYYYDSQEKQDDSGETYYDYVPKHKTRDVKEYRPTSSDMLMAKKMALDYMQSIRQREQINKPIDYKTDGKSIEQLQQEVESMINEVNMLKESDNE